ncbi:hypothetical protein ABW21_db0207272 [Orbilia brochopaga]|nr:hypothetical protein ABW21_db0207272 [Drechslerella brochopaga]
MATSRPRSRTLATADSSKRRSLPVSYDSRGGTTEPAAAYISTRISPPPSPLPVYENYKEQRLYNYVMSGTSSSSSPSQHTSGRHVRGDSISSQPDGNFFTNLFTVNPPSNPSSRPQSFTAVQQPGAGRRISTFFGLGNANDAASNSGLAFTASSPSSKRSVSNSTTLSKLVLPDQYPMTTDEFADLDFTALLGEQVPVSPLNCTPAGFRNLHDKSIELIDRIYASYLERTRALSDALAEIEALRDEREAKEQKIEGLKFSVEQLANVQETIAKASEEAERAAERANAEVKKLRAENIKLQWEQKSDDEVSSRYGGRGKVEGLAPVMRPRTKSSNSDSGFESESDSGSVFSHDSTLPPHKTSGNESPPTYPPSIAVADEDMDTSSTSSTGTGTGTGPLAQLRNVLRRTTEGRCDCSVVISRLKSENGGLVERVRELEGCLDGCLDLVSGV